MEDQNNLIKETETFLDFQIKKIKNDQFFLDNSDSNSKRVSGSSNAVKPSALFGEGVSDIIPPPIDLTTWAQAPLVNPRLSRLIRTVARNTVGLGVDIIPEHEITKDTPSEEILQIKEESKKLKQFLDTANPDLPFTSVMCQIKQDVETLGNGYLEITRTNIGHLRGLYHVPGITMRILKSDRGYVQLVHTGSYSNISHSTASNFSQSDKIYFKKLGLTDEEVQAKFPGAENAIMNKNTGRFVGEYLNGRNEEDGREGEPDFVDIASEILHIRIFNTVDSYYGIPKHFPNALEIAGNRLAARRNVAFFKNDAVPRMAALVSNGILTKTSKDNLENLFRQGQGPDEAHRILILEVEKDKTKLLDDKAVRPSIELKPLTIGVNEDGTYMGYMDKNNDSLRESFGVAQIFFRSDDINKASAQVSKKITDEQEFEPERIEIEYLLNHKLFKQEPLNITMVKLKFKRPETTDLLEQGQYLKFLSTVGALTPNDIREDLGREPYPKDFLFGDKPLVISVPELQMGLSPTTINNEGLEELDRIKEENSKDKAKETTPKDVAGEEITPEDIKEKSMDDLFDIIQEQQEMINKYIKMHKKIKKH